MTPEQWNQVDELFHEALDMPHGERTAWVERISSDAEVRRELLSLLECDREAVGSVERKVKSAVTSMFEERAENLRLREEVKELKERLKVLERITVEKENSLAKEIESLRDR